MKVITIGRNKENNNVIINDEKISRSHLQLVQDDQGNYYATDLGSTNGTFVNGQRISGQTPLHTGDEVRIGNTILPWQDYFSVKHTESGTAVNSMGSIQHTTSHSTHRKWWLWAIIGAFSLICLVALILWISHKPCETPNSKHKLDSLQIEAANAEIEYQEALKDSALLRLQYDSLEMIDLKKLSKEEKEEIEREKKELQQKIDLNKAELKSKETKVKELNTQISNLEKELQEERRAKKLETARADQAEERADQAEAREKAREGERDAAERALQLTNDMYDILNGWDEKTAKNFCDSQNPKWTYRNSTAKKTISENFKQKDNDTRQIIINNMRNHKKSNGAESDSSQSNNSKDTENDDTSSEQTKE